MQIGLFCQNLLGHPAFLAEFADVLTDSFMRLKSGHSRLQKQVRKRYSISGGLIKLAGLILACIRKLKTQIDVLSKKDWQNILGA
jgi:hypothetical protein